MADYPQMGKKTDPKEHKAHNMPLPEYTGKISKYEMEYPDRHIVQEIEESTGNPGLRIQGKPH